MLSPTWPAPSRALRGRASARVRRRVKAALRRSLRMAVAVGGSIVACLVAIDAGLLLIGFGERGRMMAAVQLAEMAAAVGLALAARRALLRPEALALFLTSLVFAVTLLRVWLVPELTILSATYLTTILVGSGLFLAWSPRWHAGWLGGALVATAGFAFLPSSLAVAERAYLLAAVVVAAGTSLVGQPLWQGRLQRMLAQQFELRYLSRYSQRQESHVLELNRELNRSARLDPLTGVGNRLALDEGLARLLDQGDRLRPARFALVLFDIDHFKAYNDEHGHLAGDAALGRLGEVLRRATRDRDLAFRYGGEEFLLLLPDVGLADAIRVAERVCVAVEESEIGGLPAFTISGGVALCDPADGRDPAPLLRRADAALYLAKRAGRNRIAADELSVAMQRREIASA